MRIRDAHNVIVRNLTVADAYDCFPVWDPTDTAVGNWNSAYDNVSVWTSTSVWVDHNTFDDGAHPHSALPVVFGRPFETHDGLLDITHGSDLVTVSYNTFENHDKTELIGSSDSRPQDRGQHRVTLHHNHWIDIGQRAPRVRFGDVHLYDNLYTQTTEGLFQYYWGAGIESSIYAENNAFELAPGVDPARIITRWAGTQLFETGSTVNGQPTDILAAFNATAPVPLAPTARWNPADVYDYTLDPVEDVPAIVRAEAGAGVLASGTPVATAAPGCRRALRRQRPGHGPVRRVLHGHGEPLLGPERHGRQALRERRARRRRVAHRHDAAPPDGGVPDHRQGERDLHLRGRAAQPVRHQHVTTAHRRRQGRVARRSRSCPTTTATVTARSR